MFFGLAVVVTIFGAFIYSRVLKSTNSGKHNRLSWPRDTEVAFKDQNDEPAKKPAKEDKESKFLAIRDAKSHASMAKRAQAKIVKFVENENLTLRRTNLLYGEDEDGNKDLRAFPEFTDGSFALVYSREDPNGDMFVYFRKEDIKDIQEILDRQLHR